MRDVGSLVHPGVLDQSAVPSRMQVARIAPALTGAKLDDMDAVAALRLPDGMEWLVNVSDEVDDELQRLDAVVAGRTLVAQHALEILDPVHYAILVVVLCPLVPVLRAVAVPRIGEALRVLGNIDKMPVVGLVALGTNLVRPVGDRRQSVVADERLDVALGDLGQALLRDVGDDPMPLLPPAVEGDCRGEHRCQHRHRCPFHRVPDWSPGRWVDSALAFTCLRMALRMRPEKGLTRLQ